MYVYLQGKIKGTWYFEQLYSARRHKNWESRHIKKKYDVIKDSMSHALIKNYQQPFCQWICMCILICKIKWRRGWDGIHATIYINNYIFFFKQSCSWFTSECMHAFKIIKHVTIKNLNTSNWKTHIPIKTKMQYKLH